MTRRKRNTGRVTPEKGGGERVVNYRQLRNPFAPQGVFTQDRVEAIHDTALKVLEDLGMKITLPEAREIFASSGALVDHDTQMVRIGRELVEAALKRAPKSIRQQAINPERSQCYELGTMVFGPGAGCPNVSDAKRGRRPGSLKSFRETTKLQQSFDVIHLLAPSAEPQDISVNLRHLDMTASQMTLSDKPLFFYARGTGQTEDIFEMIRIGYRLSDDDFLNQVWAKTVINSNSPRLLDIPMAQGIIDTARAGQLSIITPFCLAGAMAPITVAGALTLQHAEAMAGITLAQLSRPGAPVMNGGFSSNVDMKSGAPAFGTPEHVKTILGAGQLARHIGLPWRSASGAASNCSDAQGATETLMGGWANMMAGATMTLHSAGWLEGGLTFGYEKFINDIEALQTLAELCTPTGAGDDDLAFAAIADVQPGGHFFATEHTMQRYKSAFYQPLVADLTPFGSWQEAGAKTSAERATDIWQQKLLDFTPPKAAEGIEELLRPFIERRKNAGGAAPVS